MSRRTRPARPTLEAAFPVVGVGGSAGGLLAFQQLLGELPARPGFAVVVIAHLDPSRASQLVELLRATTPMHVEEATDGLELQSDHVYVIAPNTTLTLAAGRFQSTTPRDGGPVNTSVNDFFQTLADSCGSRAVGVVLSGTASDGAEGMRAIKAAGGTTFAQDGTAQYPGMPKASIDAGAVDCVLDAASIGRRLAELAHGPLLVGTPESRVDEPDPDSPEMTAILEVVRQRTGIDFLQYKPATLARRIARRMALMQVRDAAAYLELMNANGDEADRLREDLLIHVTSFFRDPASFEAIAAQVLPVLFADGGGRGPLRVWVPACATGEEAYSMAILLLEHMAKGGLRRDMQIFGTDVDDKAIAKARVGIYPATIAAEVGQKRLDRFFTRLPDGRYEVQRALRDACLFARHDLARDPPFSRLDLVSCRNVLIYLGAPLQTRILATFHYALRPGGFLTLGASETVERNPGLFAPVDKRNRIYVRTAGTPPTAVEFDPRPAGPQRPERASAATKAFNLAAETDRLVLESHAPPGVVVDEAGEILLIRGETSPILQPAPGRPGLNLRHLVRDDLQAEFAAALEESRQRSARVRRERVVYRTDGQLRYVTLDVQPVPNPSGGPLCYLMLFEHVAAPETSGSAAPADPVREAGLQAEVDRLNRALATQRKHQQAIIATLELSNQELQAAQEELLSTNEEYQSANEELETAKEEVQSANEELLTVNDQLRSQNSECSRVTSDLQNVLAGLQTPILIVDRDLRIKRMTAPAQRLFNAIPTDIDRRITDLHADVDVPDLEGLVQTCLADLSPILREVRDRDGHWYELRVQPYRSTSDHIDGAILLFGDIDAAKRAALKEEKERLLAESVIDTMREPLLLMDAGLRIQRANEPFYRTFGVGDSLVRGLAVTEICGGALQVPALQAALDALVHSGTAFNDLEVDREFPGIGRRVLVLNGRPVPRAAGEGQTILITFDDVTRRRTLREEVERLQRAELDNLASLNTFKGHFINMAAHELGNPLTALAMQVAILGEEPKRLTPEQARCLAIIGRSTDRLRALVADMLVSARFQSGHLQITKRHIDLSRMVTEIADTYRDVAREAKVSLDVPNMPPLLVDADQDHLGQVIQNLVSNAIKYTPPGGKVWVGVERVGARARVTVRDNGIGLSAEGQQRLFQPFERVHDQSYTVAGTGLGLYICKGIVELHGGTIVGESSGPGKGSTFTVEIPA